MSAQNERIECPQNKSNNKNNQSLNKYIKFLDGMWHSLISQMNKNNYEQQIMINSMYNKSVFKTTKMAN